MITQRPQMLVLSGRWDYALKALSTEQLAQIAPRGVDYELQRQFYDTADAAFKPSMDAILDYIPVSQIVFGTDCPYVTVGSNVQELHAGRLPDAQMQAIQRENVLRLIPQLRT